MSRLSLPLAVSVLAILIVAAVPPPSAAGSSHLAGKKLVLDPGHGGSDPGAVGNGLQEKAINLDVALRARDLLEAEGATVLMTRTTDATVSLGDRTSFANAHGADRYVSIHSNSCGGCGGTGTETYYCSCVSSGSTSAALAGLVQAEVVEHGGLRDRGVKTANFYVLRNTNMPAVLVELGFVDTSGDAAKLGSPAWREQAARALLHAVQRHYGIAPHDPDGGGTPGPWTAHVAAPADGAWVTGTVTVRGAVNDEENLEWMRLLVDGAVRKWVTLAPHEWAWATAGDADGAHTLKVEARAKDGRLATHAVTVRVDNTAPTVTITSPRDGAAHAAGLAVDTGTGATVVLGSVRVEASAADTGSGVSTVRFLVDGALRHADGSPPYAWDWDASTESPGAHRLTVVATDGVGLTATDALDVDVVAPGP